MRWIVTGGAGFIGSHFVRCALQYGWAQHVVVLDALTYAGDLRNLETVWGHRGLSFQRVDIADEVAVVQVLSAGAEALFHFAAESHGDRSIHDASTFVRTNVLGTQVPFDAARASHIARFVHVSTDEVYGSLPLGTDERFSEDDPLDPTSPYAASKAAADLLVLAAHRTHGDNVVITRCGNNYGPYQFPEKFIPLFITHALDGKPLPLYGDGLNVRDWIHVDDHVRGIHLAFQRGQRGAIYNLGGDCERDNRTVALAIVDGIGADRALIRHVNDRPGHDRRYAMNCQKARRELGFVPGPAIEQHLPDVVAWYKAHRSWWVRP